MNDKDIFSKPGGRSLRSRSDCRSTLFTNDMQMVDPLEATQSGFSQIAFQQPLTGVYEDKASATPFDIQSNSHSEIQTHNASRKMVDTQTHSSQPPRYQQENVCIDTTMTIGDNQSYRDNSILVASRPISFDPLRTDDLARSHISYVGNGVFSCRVDAKADKQGIVLQLCSQKSNTTAESSLKRKRSETSLARTEAGFLSMCDYNQQPSSTFKPTEQERDEFKVDSTQEMDDCRERLTREGPTCIGVTNSTRDHDALRSTTSAASAVECQPPTVLHEQTACLTSTRLPEFTLSHHSCMTIDSLHSTNRKNTSEGMSLSNGPNIAKSTLVSTDSVMSEAPNATARMQSALSDIGSLSAATGTGTGTGSMHQSRISNPLSSSSTAASGIGSFLADTSNRHSPTLPSPTMSPTLHYSHQHHSTTNSYSHQLLQLHTPPPLVPPPHHSVWPLATSDSLCDTMSLGSTQGLSRSLDLITSLPLVLDSFEALPTAVKNHVMTQLLKRCPFSSLQFMSSLILPSLKRDFIGQLPVELSYQIIAFLDLKTLGRCQRVSKSWLSVVDGEGSELSIWKRRLVNEGFVDDDEISTAFAVRSALTQSTSSDELGSINNNLKSHHTLGNYNSADNDSHSYNRPDSHPPVTPLSRSSSSMSLTCNTPQHPRPIYRHLYKKLYRRHHLIRRNWLLGRYHHISFPGHGPNVVTCLQFDTEKIVSGSDDQTIHVYNTADGTLLKRLEGHEGGVWALQYWKNTLVSGSTDRSVRVWDIENGECSHIFDGHTSTVRCLMIIIPQSNDATDDGIAALEHPVIVTGSRDATLRVWRLPDPRRDPHWSPAMAAMMTAQYREESEANLHATPRTPDPNNPNLTHLPRQPPPDVSNPYFMHVLLGHSNSVRAIAGQGNVLVSGSYDCTIRVWDITKGECVHIFRGHREKVYSVGYCHELRRAVSGSMDATVKVWCTRTGVALFNLEGHTSLVGLLELSPNYLVSAAADATLRVWSPVTGQCLSNLTGHSAAITCFHHDPKCNRIVSGSDGGIKIWELSSVGYGTNTGLMGANSNGVIPSNCPLSDQLAFTQGANGPEPVYGRFLRDTIGGVQGVWRVRTDETRLVCAVQREEGGTWFEVLNFDVDNDAPSGSKVVSHDLTSDLNAAASAESSSFFGGELQHLDSSSSLYSGTGAVVSTPTPAGSLLNMSAAASSSATGGEEGMFMLGVLPHVSYSTQGNRRTSRPGSTSQPMMFEPLSQ
ncbi:hypothetical protein BDV3_000616 [Batrachochytrium dendrobatidis]